jgi:hypothetical protein
LDIAIAGGLAVTVTTTDVTLTNTAGTSSATNIGATSAQYAILNVSGAMTAARNLIVPSSSKSYIINNNTTGGFVLTVKGSATSGVGLVNGEKALVAWNGTDYVKAANTFGAGNFTTLATTDGIYVNGTNSDAAMTGSYVRFGTNIGLQSNAANSALVAKMFNGSIFTDALTLNTSGNLGLGVTPSAWFSVYKAMQLGSYGSAIAGQTNDQSLSLWNNAYPNASNVDTYTTTNAATKFRMEGGQYKFFNAPSGTAGTAITFTQAMTLDASGNLGVGTTSPQSQLHINKSGSVVNGVTIGNGNNGLIIGVGTDGNGRIGSYSGPQPLRFGQYAGGVSTTFTEQMQLDASGRLTSTANGVDNLLTLTSNAGAFSSRIDMLSSAGGGSVINASQYLGFLTGSTERARIDSSGNLGVGVTPNGSYKLQVNGGAYTTAYNVGSGGANNAAFTGTFDTDGAGTARFYSRGGTTSTLGGFNWHNQSSNGSVDATAMTLDTSGNLGVGVTPQSGARSPSLQVGGGGVFRSESYTSTNNQIKMLGNAYEATDTSFKYLFTDSASQYRQTSGVHAWYNAPSGTAGTAITFTQAMTLDASGNLLVGGTTATGKNYTYQSANSIGIGVETTGGGYTSNAFQTGVYGTTGSSAFNHIACKNAGAVTIFAVRGDGYIYTPNLGAATGTAVVLNSNGFLYTLSSSLRYKKDVTPIDIGLNFILGLKPVKYNLIETDEPQVGFIAEDFPDSRLVSMSKVDKQDDSKGLQPESVNYAQIVAPLVKAIQEQQVLIESLTARVAQLESK